MLVTVLLLAMAVYAGFGLVFAAGFLPRGIGRVDHAAAGAGWRFRVLLIPGIVAFWPLLAVKWANSTRGDEA